MATKHDTQTGSRSALGAVVAVGLAFSLTAVLVVREPVLQARCAGVGLGVVVSMLAVLRPPGFWDSPVIRSWRDLLGSRVVRALYLAIGIGIIAGAMLVPLR